MAEKRQHTIIRVAGKDLAGAETVENSLRGIRGVSFMTARAILIRSGIDRSIKLGDLPDADIKKLERIMENPQDFDFPHWLLNKRKDYETGVDTHLVETDLMLKNREELERMKKLRTYRGIRHMFGLKVRGQRTRSTGRKNKMVTTRRKVSKPAAIGGKR
ncbi:MAG: 30S ribosomal protein S13 [archaeon]